MKEYSFPFSTSFSVRITFPSLRISILERVVSSSPLMALVGALNVRTAFKMPVGSGMAVKSVTESGAVVGMNGSITMSSM